MDGMTVEVTVASKDVRRLASARTNKIAQNLGPFWNCGWPFSVVASWASTEASLDSRVEAAASCCVIVSDKTSSRCREYYGMIGRPLG